LLDVTEFHVHIRAKVIVGDKDTEGGKKTAQEIIVDGGCVFFWEFPNQELNSRGNRHATFVKCDTTVWEDQVSMFETAISTYGSVDIVVNIIHLLGFFLHDPYSQSRVLDMSLNGKIRLGS